YHAPELLRGADADPCTAAYALGVTALEALLGRCPLEGTTYDIASRITADDVPRASLLLPGATRYLVAAIDGLLEPVRELRASVGVARNCLQSHRGLAAWGGTAPPP